MKVSVVIPSHNEGEMLLYTVTNLLTTNPEVDQVIVVDDGSDDGSSEMVAAMYPDVEVVHGEKLGVAGARNLGSQHATGDAIVFLDAHSYAPRGWLKGLTEPFEDQSVGIVCPGVWPIKWSSNSAKGMGQWLNSAQLKPEWMPAQDSRSPYQVMVAPGGCQAVRRCDFEAIGRFDAGMTRWGSEDAELSLRYWQLGFDVMVHPRVAYWHHFRSGGFPYAVDQAGIIYNRLRMGLTHLSEARFERVLEHYSQESCLPGVINELMRSDVNDRRQDLVSQRKRDDTWILERFGVTI